MSRHPTIRWAQTAEKLFITVDLPDAQNVKLKLEPQGKFSFSAFCGAEKIPYEIDIDLYDNVNINESKARVGMRNIRYVIEKAEKKWWSRLLKQQGKPPVFVKVDWDKWIDEDEKKVKHYNMDLRELDFSKLALGASASEDVDNGEGGDAGDVFGKNDGNVENDDKVSSEKEGGKLDRALIPEAVNEPVSTSNKPDAKA